MVEPLIIIFLGLIVGVILIAMYLPLFQMSNSFQQNSGRQPSTFSIATGNSIDY
jgi:uncharacterized integral membrane protein